MKNINLSLYTLFILAYMLLSMCFFNPSNIGFNPDGGENSFEMKLYLVSFAILSIWTLINIRDFQNKNALVYIPVALIFFSVFNLLLTSMNLSIKELGTALVFSTVPLLVFLNFFLISYKGILTPKIFIISGVILFTFNAILFLRYYTIFRLTSDQRFVLNNFYALFLLMPWLLLIRNKFANMVIFFIFAVITALSERRAVFLAFLLAIFVFHLISVSNSRRNFAKSFLIYTIILIILLAFISFYIDFSAILARMQTIGEDQGSGRITLYSYLIENIVSSNPIELLIGHGLYFSSRFLTSAIGFAGAHNDYLGYMYDLGLIGLILQLSMIFLFMRYFARMMKRESPYAPTFGLSLAMFFIFSMVSAMFLAGFSSVLIFAFFGFVLGNYERNERMNRFLPLRPIA